MYVDVGTIMYVLCAASRYIGLGTVHTYLHTYCTCKTIEEARMGAWGNLEVQG